MTRAAQSIHNVDTALVTASSGGNRRRDRYGMTPQQRSFVDLYLMTDNATKAYMEVYTLSTQDSARSSASELLAKSNISSYVDMRRGIVRKQMAKKYSLSKERVDAELAKLAFANVQDLYDHRGVPILPHLLDRDVAAAIKDVGTDGYKLHDKKAVLDLISKNEGFQDKHQRAGQSVTVIKVPDITKGEGAGRE
jgi:phage terminase small subunit